MYIYTHDFDKTSRLCLIGIDRKKCCNVDFNLNFIAIKATICCMMFFPVLLIIMTASYDDEYAS